MDYCDDGGACHHNCADRSGKCYRRQCCEPLSNVFPNDEWPPPSGAEVHGTDPTLKPTSTPSITIGTQVRLTGVVVGPTRKEDDAQGVLIKGSAVEGLRGPLVFIKPDYLEVIRQPFKRGEVVYGTSGGDTYVVFNDERDGKVDVVDVTAGVSGLDEDAIDYERRP